ncbi:MAG: HAMP domain-containing histidine kinase [Clostridia bacterium]|nr:HAMP domain-containing histidine kinase [Clostridia bacterium]
MKLRSKIIVVFIISIIISVIVFIFVTAYLLSHGLWSGFTQYDMNKAVREVEKEIISADSIDKSKVSPIFKQKEKKYEGMIFELLSKDMEIIYSTNGIERKFTTGRLLEALSYHGSWDQKEWLAAREVTLMGGQKGVILVLVPQDEFMTMILAVNGVRGAGVMGIIFLVGLGITLVVSSVFAVLFTIRISRRFSQLYNGINSFELGNLDVSIPDNSRDELGKLARNFNNMSGKLKKQFDQDKAFQEERRKLVSNISHDLRTPLTSIIGYSESLENGVYENEEERNKYIGIIRRRALYMEKLLGELLEFSRMESGNFELDRSKNDLAELCRELLIEYMPILQDKDIELNADIPDYPVPAEFDRDRISRVLRNLMDNAVKYGCEGRYISLSVRDTEKTVQVEIEDRGNGIEREHVERIFDRFYRADKSRNTRDGGMGLGLAIADEIVRRHEGRIEVKSEIGQGTKFTVFLPK